MVTTTRMTLNGFPYCSQTNAFGHFRGISANSATTILDIAKTSLSLSALVVSVSFAILSH